MTLAVYVHWPFCLRKCPYCDFNSHGIPGGGEVDHDRWCRALLAEMGHFAAETGGRRLSSLFFGGGTPSLMAATTVAAVIERALGLWPPASGEDVEITLEANPGAAEAGPFRDYRAAGVNRLSLGVQALDGSALRKLGRVHGVAEALAAIDLARSTFPRMSLDLIYARPGQTMVAWERELAQVLALAGDHLSLYTLTIEDGTPFAARQAAGNLPLPEEETAALLFEKTQAMTEAAGLPAYEVSNHARPGAECRHNLSYWRSGDYLGIGPGAHGRLRDAGGTWAIRQHAAPRTWLEQVETFGHATAERMRLSRSERETEILLMGLRLNAGIDAARFLHLTGRSLGEAVDPEGLAMLVEEGYLVEDAFGLRTTPRGRLMLNAVVEKLVR
ncbi:MAG: radical SAM family heme chaperone HemW [Alphaproteobacteria bacterium]